MYKYNVYNCHGIEIRIRWILFRWMQVFVVMTFVPYFLNLRPMSTSSLFCRLLGQALINRCNSKKMWYLPVTWWRHQMETFSALLALCAGIHRSPVYSPYKGQWHGTLKFSLICAWTNGWVKNRGAGDSRRHCAHYDVIVMRPIIW